MEFAFETSGRLEVMETALAALTSPENARSINIASLITFCHGIITELLGHYKAGRFPFERLIQTFPSAEINAAIDAQHRGACVKAVLVP